MPMKELREEMTPGSVATDALNTGTPGSGIPGTSCLDENCCWGGVSGFPELQRPSSPQKGRT